MAKKRKSRIPLLKSFLLNRVRLVGPGAIAHYLRISRHTLMNHEKTGKLPIVVRRDPKGRRTYTKEDFLELYRYFYSTTFAALRTTASARR